MKLIDESQISSSDSVAENFAETNRPVFRKALS